MDITRLTRDEPERFARCFVQTAATKAGEHDGVSIEAYGAELGHLPIDAVERAADQIRRMPDDFMPSAGYWFNLADDLAAKAIVADTAVGALPAPIDEDELSRTQRAYHAMIDAARDSLGDAVAVAISKAARMPQRVPTYACTHCTDVGWITLACTEDDQCLSCQRRGGPYDHTYVRRCACFPDNPQLARLRAFARAQRPSKERRQHGR